MKNISVFSLFILILINGLLCNAQTAKKETKGVSSVNVEAYYFHLSARCVTCKAVEAEAKKSLESLYGGKVSFQAINLEDAANKAIVEKMQISGQTLLVVKGGTKINLTNEGFLYARSNPEKFKSIIKEKVDRLIKL
ncbi:MAG: nitrophenyl compound nitroreductase subunit ArsF family protein [Mariniphaga sp.]